MFTNEYITFSYHKGIVVRNCYQCSFVYLMNGSKMWILLHFSHIYIAYSYVWYFIKLTYFTDRYVTMPSVL